MLSTVCQSTIERTTHLGQALERAAPSNVQQYQQLRLHVSEKPSNVQQDVWLNVEDYTARASHRTYSIKSSTHLPIIKKWRLHVSVDLTPRVLLLRFILPILMKISRGTDTEASDYCSVRLSCFNSFLRALGAWIKKTGRKKEEKKWCGFSNN